MLDGVCGQNVDLLDRVLRDLVGKGAQANHRLLSRCRIKRVGLGTDTMITDERGTASAG
jgi:hypothetical protein